MFLFLDESGDLGFDFSKKATSKYFIITVLVSRKYGPISFAIQRTRKAKLGKKNKVQPIRELKGTSTVLSIKEYFYKQLMKYDDWYLRTIILDKTTFKDENQLVTEVHSLYNKLSKNVLDSELLNANEEISLSVDKSKNPHEIKIFNEYIRANLSNKIHIEHLYSQNSDGLQAVDLFCYGIARKYEANDHDWYNVFANKIKLETIFRQ